MEITWPLALEKVKKHTFNILTPQGSGTGFLIKYGARSKVCGVATALHVIRHALTWEEPIKLLPSETSKEIFLRHSDRYILANPSRDLAVIMFMKGDHEIETTTLPLSPEDKYLKPGVELGWAGYPVLAPDEFSFFSGRVSCVLQKEKAYLVDGVAINGVSGGPAFAIFGSNIHLVGVVSAYFPNRVAGESLPGVCFVVSVSPLYKVVKGVKSLEDAKEVGQQQPPA